MRWSWLYKPGLVLFSESTFLLPTLHYTLHTPIITMSFQDFPAELKVEVMTQLGSLQTLREVLTAMPSLIPLFNAHFYGITKELLKTAFQPQLHPYIYAILAAHFSVQPQTVNELESFLTHFFGQRGKAVKIAQPSFLSPSSASPEDIFKPLGLYDPAKLCSQVSRDLCKQGRGGA